MFFVDFSKSFDLIDRDILLVSDPDEFKIVINDCIYYYTNYTNTIYTKYVKYFL